MSTSTAGASTEQPGWCRFATTWHRVESDSWHRQLHGKWEGNGRRSHHTRLSQTSRLKDPRRQQRLPRSFAKGKRVAGRLRKALCCLAKIDGVDLRGEVGGGREQDEVRRLAKSFLTEGGWGSSSRECGCSRRRRIGEATARPSYVSSTRGQVARRRLPAPQTQQS